MDVPSFQPNPARPLTYHDRTHHVLPTDSYQLQEELNKLVTYSQANHMRINQDKCKVMIFNSGRKYDGMPWLTLSGAGDCYLEVVERFKLLGVIIRSDMKWYDNTDFICQKGYTRLWMLRRLKGLGASEEEMFDVYTKQVRSVLELAVPVWQPALTQNEVKQIERVQRCALYIILGEQYLNYEHARNLLNCEDLNERRLKLCENFVKKAAKSHKFKSWFSESVVVPPSVHTRGNEIKIIPKFKPVPTRTDRYRDSPLPYLTDIINELMPKMTVKC